MRLPATVGIFCSRRFAPAALLLAIVIVIGAKSVLTEIARAAGDAGRLIDVVAGVSAMMVGGLLFALCERRLWTADAAGAEAPAAQKSANGTGGGPWPALRLAGRSFGVLLIAAALAGHVNLADFVSTRIYYLALLIGLAWFVRAALKESAAWADRRLKSGKPGGETAGDSQAFQFWIGAGIDLVLLIAVAPALFVLAGVDVSAVRDLVARAFAGFRVGGVVISLSDIFFSVAVFVGILTATRVLQGALQRGPLAHSRMDSGIQNSLTTLFGYAGLVVAAIVGLGMLGVDFSNLALIAGALSVGIGFGLQSIVNNFVSGLILLFERPIKAGDWIVTASGEGIVKKISVRSTEIETFDRASIIIPNSELIASTVTNWTHKSALGRIRVAVGVSYDSDPDLVREILLKCGNDHPLVVRYPEPFVVWMDFGASSLDFELRAFISDIAKGLQVPLAVAERIKTKHGGVVATGMDDREMIVLSNSRLPTVRPAVVVHDFVVHPRLLHSSATRRMLPASRYNSKMRRTRAASALLTTSRRPVKGAGAGTKS